MAERSGDRVIKRSVTIAGHRTSVSLEAAFWEALKEIANGAGISVNQLVTRIDAAGGETAPRNLSSAIRVHVLRHWREPERSSLPGTHPTKKEGP